MDFFSDIFHNLALLEFYFLNIIYILLYIDFILSIFFQHSNILTRASHHWCLASNIVLVFPKVATTSCLCPDSPKPCLCVPYCKLITPKHTTVLSSQKTEARFNIRCHLTSIEIPIVEIRRSSDRLISTMGIPILVQFAWPAKLGSVRQASFPSLPYINFGKIVLQSSKFQILFWRLQVKCHLYIEPVPWHPNLCGSKHNWQALTLAHTQTTQLPASTASCLHIWNSRPEDSWAHEQIFWKKI